MDSKKPLTIYWSPAPLVNEQMSWHLLYRNPVSVLKKIIDEQGGEMKTCPSVKLLLKNTFTFTSAIDDSFEFDLDTAKEMSTQDLYGQEIPRTNSKVPLYQNRPSSLTGYTNATYYLSWIFFSEEPIEAYFTAPYFPPKAPMTGALFSPGTFNIGKWFRPIPLDYHLPLTDNKFNIEKDDELMYVRFNTDRKIILKRFEMTKNLWNLADECIFAHERYGKGQPIEEKYEMALSSSMPQRILKEIKSSLGEY